MKILKWFAGERSNIEALPDAIWMTRAAKFAGIARLIAERFQADDAPLAIILVAHFPDTLAELQTIADAEDVGGPVTAVAAGELNHVSTSAAIFGESETIEIIVGERHPLRSHDDEVADFALGLPCRCRIGNHLSLDDPLMKAFAGEWVQGVLQKLGMQERESIQSDVVSQRLKRAQQKIASRAINDEPADSADEWMDRNPGR